MDCCRQLGDLVGREYGDVALLVGRRAHAPAGCPRKHLYGDGVVHHLAENSEPAPDAEAVSPAARVSG